MSGLLRELFTNLYIEQYNDSYEDKTINNIRYGNFNFNPVVPQPLIIDFNVVPTIIDNQEEVISEDTYPTKLAIDFDNIKDYPELVEIYKSNNNNITLEEYVIYIKNYLRKNDPNYLYNRLLYNPVEINIKLMPVRYICRASYKLANIDYVFDIMQDNNNFVDLCGGPGGFSEYILDKYPNTAGIGMTLKTNNASLDWKINNFRPNIDRNRFVISYGKNYMTGSDNMTLVEGTGDITDINNIDALTEQVTKCNPEGVYLVTADGAGFEEEEQELDSIELYQFKIFIGEAFTATQILKKGGNFVLKIFKTKYICTQTFLMIIASLFEKSYIFKPITSRVGNSERYFIGKGFKYSPSDKIYYDYFKNVLSLTDVKNYQFLESTSPQVAKYFFETSLENLQRQYVFCRNYLDGYKYNWKNFISIKKLSTLILKK